MRNLLRAFLFVAPLAASSLHAQNNSKGMRTAYTVSDFGKLRWLEGRWQGVAYGEPAVYQKIHFVNDTTVEIGYFRDPGFTQSSTDGRLYLSVGRVFHSFGANQWVATHVDSDGIFFVPQNTARNNFAWNYVSPDSWVSVMRTGIGGRERVIRYEMTRIK